MFGDEEFTQQDGKYRGYVAGMEKALKNFEYSSEWPDLIAALGKLSKVISSHSGKYKVIPRRLLLSKRLSQCLHPSLPSGVHLKALETYDLVFKSIGKEQLALELFIYSAGLFPLLNYAGISVRLSLLTIYETHLIPLGEKLIPCLDGFLPAILLGMEETSDFYQRTTVLLDSVKASVGYTVFFTSIWRCIEVVPATRQPAINYMLADKESILGDDFDQIQRAMRLGLLDNNILVQRASLELLSTRSELGNGLELIKAALKTLLRRDSSLNRRLVSWLSNSEAQLIEAIQSLLCENDEDNFRLLVYLFDKSELVSENIIDTILVDIIRSLYIHNGSYLQQRSANLFFTTLHSSLIWDHFYKQLENCIQLEDTTKVQQPGAGRASVSELCLLLQFLIQLDSTLDKTYLPTLNGKLLQLIVSNLSSLNYVNLHSLLQLISKEGETELFNDLYVQFVTQIFFVSHGDFESVPVQFEKLMKKQIDLYDSGYDFELNLSESMESMSTNEKLVFEPIPINPHMEVFDCFRSLNSILVHIEHLQVDTLKALFIGATMVNSESAQHVCIDAIISILPKIILEIDLSTTHCIDIVTSYLWNARCFDKIFKLYQFFPKLVERVIITQLDYTKVIQLLKFGQDLENSFDSIVLRCLDDLENVDISVKAQGESFVLEFFNSIGVILDPVLNICNETLSLVNNVLDRSEIEPEPEIEFEKSISVEHSQPSDLSLSIHTSVEQARSPMPTSPAKHRTDRTVEKVEDGISTSVQSSDDVPDSEMQQTGNKVASIPIYVVDTSGKFKQEEIILPLSSDTVMTVINDDEFEDAEENTSSVSLDEMLGTDRKVNGVVDNNVTIITTAASPMEGDEDGDNTADEMQQSGDNRSTCSEGSSRGNSISIHDTSTADPEHIPEPASHLPPIWKPDLFSIHPYNTHFLLYSKAPDHARCLYALKTLRNMLDTNNRAFLISVATTTSRSRQTYLELLLSTLIRLCTSFYKESPEYGNVAVHVESMRLLGHILSGLLPVAKGNRGYCSFIGDIFSKLQLQKTILYTLASLVLIKNENDLTSTENILRLNYDTEFDIIYNEVVRLTTCLIAIESETMTHQPKMRSVTTIKYIPAVRLCRQPLYLDSLLKNLANPVLMTCHQATLTSITNALPFYGEEIGRIVQSVLTTVCYELLKQDLTDAYITKILETLTSITHYALIEQSGAEKEAAPQQASSHILYNLVSAFLPMATSWKEKDVPHSPKQETAHSQLSPRVNILPTVLPKLLGTLLHLWKRDLKPKILDLINPIAFTHTPVFIFSLSQQHEEVHTCVDLVHRMKVIPLPNLATTVFTAIREITGQEENQLTLLSFMTSYIEKSSNVSEIWPAVITLIKESVGQVGLSPKCQIGMYSLFAKMVVDVGVPTVKQEFKDLQEGANKLIESISSQISIEKKHKVSPNCTEVLETFSKSLPKVIDILWGADVLPLLTNIVYYLVPHVKSKSVQYKPAVSLVANLSYYSYLRKAWKKEIFEHLLEANFFMFSQNCVQPWKVTLDNLFTQDKYTFSELIARVSVPASLNLFSSKEIEYESRAMLLKRLAFVIYSSPKDQYTKFITSIQERIAEGIKMPQLVPIIQSQVFLCFRVLLLRLSPQHLTSLWPIILHEILQVLIQMENDILTRNPNLLQLYLQVCKLLELSLNLPAGQLPSFQMHRWAFIGPPTETYTPHLTRLALELEPHKSSNGVKALRSNKIECLGELYEFLSTCDQHVDIEVLERVLECDFAEL